MRKFFKITGALLGGLFLLCVLLLAVGYVQLRAGLPDYDGQMALEGLTAPVEVLRDEQGLVTIQAQDWSDAYFALGFVHAQDRLGQMEMTRRLGQGRLSEAAGGATLDFDKLLRVMRLYERAKASYDHLTARNKATVDSYVAGVNAYLTNHDGAWPPELYAMGATPPEAWTAADTLVWGKLMALQLSGNWRQELRNAALDRALSPDQIAQLLPGLPPGSPSTIEQARRDLPSPWLAALPFEMQDHGASNAWVISGGRTNSGAPLLASDPHLMLQAPAVWYLARLETPEGVLAGATAPGVPAVLIGHNGRLAWGFTTTHSDTQDLVIEKIDPEDDGRYLTPEGSQAFETWSETLQVRFGDPVEVEFRATRHGPVISDVSRDAAAAAAEDQVLALAWPELREPGTTANAILSMNHAKDPESFRAAFRDMVSPQQNVFYADTQGNIGMIAPARVPVRIGYDGSRPVSGWDRDALWTGYIPFDVLPALDNPENGLIVNANNKITPDGYPYPLASEYEEPYRALRILDLLDEDSPKDLEGSIAAQLDALSLMVADLLPLMLASDKIQEDPELEQVVFALTAWSGEMDRDRPEPLIFSAWLAALQEALIADELGSAFTEMDGWQPRSVQSLLANHPEWCDDQTTQGVESCDDILHDSLVAALTQIEDLTGDTPMEAQWGELHRARMAQPILGRIPLIGGLAAVELATDGGNYTVSRGTPSLPGGGRFGGQPFQHIHGAGMRAVFDLSDLDNSRFALSSGQSGNILSRHFGDLAEGWRDGNPLKLVAPEQADSHRLLLTP